MTPVASHRPRQFLEVIVEDAELTPPLLALCAGFEAGEWRRDQFARYILDKLVDFAFTFSEKQRLDAENATEFVRRAARLVYGTHKYKHRGEFGELLLHNILRDHFMAQPAVSKLFFKDSRNDTVKGFDAVHVVEGENGGLELWLGEAKFYGSVTAAMTAAAKEIREHTDRDWLRDEFMLIENKVDPEWPHAERFRDLIHRDASLDQLFEVIRIPLLITYDSDAVKGHPDGADPYLEECDQEARALLERFTRRKLPANVVVHLILVPLEDKHQLVKALDERLRTLQEL